MTCIHLSVIGSFLFVASCAARSRRVFPHWISRAEGADCQLAPRRRLHGVQARGRSPLLRLLPRYAPSGMSEPGHDVFAAGKRGVHFVGVVYAGDGLQYE